MTLLRCAFISDLHLDHNPGLLPLLEKRLIKSKPDIFIIAGDMFSGYSRLQASIKRLRRYCDNVLFLSGNHDLWLTESTGIGDSKELYLKTLKGAVHRAGGHYLGIEPFYFNRNAILGVTGWYNKVPEPPVTTLDTKFCRFSDMATPKDVLNWQKELLKSQLDEASEKAKKIIVVTHTVPFLDLIKDTIDSKLLDYMGSSELGEIIRQYPKVVYVISGHIHERLLFNLKDLSVPWEVSPFGYPKELGETQIETLNTSLRLIEF